MATISKRKKTDGRWQAIVDLPPDPQTGKRRRKWLYADDRSTVKRMANQLEEKIASGNYVEPSKLTVEGYLLQWFDDYCSELASTTQEGYMNYIKGHIIPFMGKKKLQKVKPVDIQRFYNSEYEKGYSGTTVLQIHRILSRAFKEAMINNLIENNPMLKVKAPKKADFEPTVYDEEQFNELLNSVAGTNDEVPILLAGMLGLRRGEVLGLRWQDIDFDQKTISIIQTVTFANGKIEFGPPKTKKSRRTIAAPEGLLKVLEKHYVRQAEQRLKTGPKYKNHDLVYCRENGEPVNPRTFSRYFKDLLKKYNFPHIRFHDLRHFNATMMLKYGIDVKIASERLGHSTTDTTQKIYQHVTKDMDLEAAKKLDKIIQK